MATNWPVFIVNLSAHESRTMYVEIHSKIKMLQFNFNIDESGNSCFIGEVHATCCLLTCQDLCLQTGYTVLIPHTPDIAISCLPRILSTANYERNDNINLPTLLLGLDFN